MTFVSASQIILRVIPSPTRANDSVQVLGCFIIAVCGMGATRLWRSNRLLRRLELVDEEKRTRLLEMRYCGMNAGGLQEIPFGVRALQRGIQVEGIWTSQSLPQPTGPGVASTAVVERPSLVEETSRRKSRIDAASRYSQRVSAGHTLGHALSAASHVHSTSPVRSSISRKLPPNSYAARLSALSSRNSSLACYVPTGMSPKSRPISQGVSIASRTTSPSGGALVVDLAATLPSSHQPKEPMVTNLSCLPTLEPSHDVGSAPSKRNPHPADLPQAYSALSPLYPGQLTVTADSQRPEGHRRLRKKPRGLK